MAEAGKFNLRSPAGLFIWYGSCVLIVSKMVGDLVFRGPFEFDRTWIEAALAGLITVAVFAFIHLTVRHVLTVAKATSTADVEANQYPSPATKQVALMLSCIAALAVLNVIFGLWAHGRPEVLMNFANEYRGATSIELVEAFIAMMAAAVGSSITTIRGYLKHASDKRDFNSSYVPWYLARPAMGMMLGLIFYFVIKGGLLVLVEPGANNNVITELNPWGVAGLGALVGMFSKQAIEKLRDVFDTMFST